MTTKRQIRRTGFSSSLFLIFLFLPLNTRHSPPVSSLYAAEFEVVDRFSVNNYSEFRGSVTIKGSMLDVQNSAQFGSTSKSTFTAAGSLNLAPDAVLTLTGPLTLNGSTLTVTGAEFSVGASTFVVKAGNIGIGTTGPGATFHVQGNIKIADGTQAAGRVLTSDANGLGNWQAVSGGIPSGAVMSFNLASCPSGWTELISARGRMVVGLPASGTLAGTIGTALANLEDRTHTHTGPNHTHTYTDVITHTHSIDPPPTATDSQGSHTHSISDSGHTHVAGAQSGGGGSYVCPNWYCWGTTMPTGSSTTGISINSNGAHTHTVDIGPFTSGSTGVATGTTAASGTGSTGTAATSNVISYIQLLTCQKD